MKSLRLFALLLAVCTVFSLVSCTKREEPLPEMPSTEKTFIQDTAIELLNPTADHPNPVYRVRLTDKKGRALENTEITLATEDRNFVAATDAEGVATFTPSIKSGECAATFSFAGNNLYAASTLDAVLVTTSMADRCGVYVRAEDIDTVDFARLADKSVGTVFLHQQVLSRVSRERIEAFIADAAEHEIDVHLWLICLHDNGKFVPPIIEEEGQEGRDYNKAYFESEAEKVQKAAAIKGLAGLHFDYIRFGGEGDKENRADFYSLKNGTGHGETAITEFVRQMTQTAKSVNPDLVFSGAIMAEYADLVPKYGQDVAALSEYFDFFVPMLYAGNYEKGTDWILECMRMLRQEFPNTSFRPALLTYRSDAEMVSLTEAELTEQVRACWDGKANGVTLFFYKEKVTTLIDLSLAEA